MRRRLPLLLTLLAACAADPAPPPVAASVELPVAAAAAPPAAEPDPAPAGRSPALPGGAALTASLDVAVLERAFPPGTLGERLERALGDARALLRGIDRSRPITLAVAGVSPEARPVLDALRTLVPPAEPQGQGQGVPVDRLHGAVTAAPTALAARLLVPATDAALVHKTLASLLERAGFEAQGAGTWTHGDLRIGLGAAAGTVAIDLSRGPNAAAAIVGLRRSFADGPHAEAPALEGRALRIQATPALLADLSFLTGVAQTDAALSGEGIDPSMKARLAAQGLWESAQAYTLAGSARGSAFERLELSLRAGAAGALEGVLVAEPGPGFTGPKEEAWASSTSIDVRDAKGILDVSRAFVDTWPLPGDAADPGRALSLVKEAGAGGMVLALPQLVAWGTAQEIRRHERRLAPGDRPLAFERAGLFSPLSTGREVFFGLFPEKTTRAAAECALAEKTPCRGPRQLNLGGLTEVGGRWVRLASVGTRLVLIAGDKASVGSALGTRRVGPAVADIPLHEILEHAGLDPARFPDHLLGSVQREGRAIVFRVATP
jgi:hypothetical protein